MDSVGEALEDEAASEEIADVKAEEMTEGADELKETGMDALDDTASDEPSEAGTEDSDDLDEAECESRRASRSSILLVVGPIS